MRRLMEEICHVFLGHQPNRLSVVTKDERGKVMNRDYRKADEEEAYGSARRPLFLRVVEENVVARQECHGRLDYTFASAANWLSIV